MKTCDRFVFYCWCWWARGGGGVRRTSHFQKKPKNNDNLCERYWMKIIPAFDFLILMCTDKICTLSGHISLKSLGLNSGCHILLWHSPCLRLLLGPALVLWAVHVHCASQLPDTPENLEGFPLRPGHWASFPPIAKTLLERRSTAKLSKYFNR